MHSQSVEVGTQAKCSIYRRGVALFSIFLCKFPYYDDLYLNSFRGCTAES